MKSAKSAGMLSILGATLVAVSAPHLAVADSSDAKTQGVHTGSTQGIHTGSVLGIHTGSTQGIHTGSVLGIHTGSVLGIHTGSTQGIHTGSVLGIHTGSTQGIHTGSVLGIHTGSTQGIHTGSVLGIHTGSTQGIHTGSILGIHTGSTQGIHTGSVLGIHTGSAQGIHTGSVLGIHTGSTQGSGSTNSLVLMAPISGVDLEGGSFTAVGQRVFAGLADLQNLAEGDYVSVFGSVMGAGALYADAVNLIGSDYLPGVSEIVVSGVPSEINQQLGIARIGELNIDYTQSLHNGSHPGRGFVTFRGVQFGANSENVTSHGFSNGFTVE